MGLLNASGRRPNEHKRLSAKSQVQEAEIVFCDSVFMIFIVILFVAVPILLIALFGSLFAEDEFILNSLIISEFRVPPPGKCNSTTNINNVGGRNYLHHGNAVLSIFLEGDELLWVTRTGDFSLEDGKNIMLNVNMSTTTVSVPDSFVPTALLQAQNLRQPLRFRLQYDRVYQAGANAFYANRFITVTCGVDMQFVTDTTLRGVPTNCSHDYF